ncbi:conserved hypothetical protein [Rippkaea orientalis PCC 8801]|uniref:Uncharacterized protein n=1 Tax=Rippkaea orientalis (strain PCC 8801 / RF-1) TaxID=41431 RepID=B7K3J8_RIPO1|nr:hypothetical protein [Rippkaea orientalis]ACK65340.1 conserved hypothetical protein [Rippkaea orientalis PCC 8801]
MTKKSLSDLLREEAAQNVDVEVNNSDPMQETPDTNPSSEQGSMTNLKRMTKAQLEAKVKELMEALETTNQPNNSLENELEKQKALAKTLQLDLEKAQQSQRELEDQKALVKTLQLDLEKAQQSQRELEEQKQLVEKLYIQLQKAEEMTAQFDEQKQIIEELKTELAQTKQPQKLEPESQAMVLQKKETVMSQPRSLGRYIAPPTPDKVLTNEDIGWFD